MVVDRVTWQWLHGYQPRRYAGEGPNPLTATTPSCGAGGSMSATYPVADRHQARVNDSRTEEQGPVIGKIKSDLFENGSNFKGYHFRIFRTMYIKGLQIGAKQPSSKVIPLLILISDTFP